MMTTKATTTVGNVAAITNTVLMVSMTVCRPDGAKVRRRDGVTVECLLDRQRNMAARAIDTRDATTTTIGTKVVTSLYGVQAFTSKAAASTSTDFYLKARRSTGKETVRRSVPAVAHG